MGRYRFTLIFIFYFILLVNSSSANEVFIEINPSINSKIFLKDESGDFLTDFEAELLPLHVNIIIKSNSDFEQHASLDGWEGNGSVDDPYIIENYNVRLISISNSNYSVRIRNNFIVELELKISNSVTERTIVCLPVLIEGNNNIFSTNRLKHDDFRTGGGDTKISVYGDNNQVIGNSIINGAGGVFVSGNQNIIAANELNKNYSYYPNYNFDLNPVASVAIENGISIVGGFNLVFGNTVNGSVGYGITVGLQSFGNNISQNIFTSNSLQYKSSDSRLSQAYEHPESLNNVGINPTSNTFEFNYWGDFTLPDTDENLIVDQSYKIDGKGSYDNYPRVDEIAIPQKPVEINETAISENNDQKEDTIKDEMSETLTISKFIIPTIIGMVFITTSLAATKFIYHQKAIQGMVRNNQVKKVLTGITDLKLEWIPLIFGQKSVDSSEDENFYLGQFPAEIVQHKFMLQPVRLAIIKILFENTQFTSRQIKSILNVSWSELNNHVLALQQKGYVEIFQQFIDGKLTNLITITSLGNEKFTEVKTVLNDFLNL